MNLFLPHISFARLADLVENRVLPEDRAALLEHLTGCSYCSGQAQMLENVVGLMRTDHSVDAPPELIARAVNLFPRRLASAEPSMFKRVMAALTFDSSQLSPAYGLRSGQTAARQLLYSVGEQDIDIHLMPSGEIWEVSGQVLGPCTGGKVEIQNELIKTEVKLNELCEFTLPALPPGTYTLRLHLADIEIEIPDFVLKS